MPPGAAITELLRRVRAGDDGVRSDLLDLLYDELHELARAHMSRQESAHTLQSTALVHEAWLKIGDPTDRDWASRREFFALASQTMRSVLVDHARRKRTEKRGADAVRLTIDEASGSAEDPGFDLVDLDEALTALCETDAELGRYVELRFFGGMTNREVSEHLETPLRSVERGMQVAKLWLRDRLEE